MTSSMGRKRQSNFDLPPRMHVKSGTYYYVTTDKPRKWISLGKDLAQARTKWAELENGSKQCTTVCDLIDLYFQSDKFAEKAESTQKMYKSVAEQVKAFFGQTDARAVTTGIIAQWMDGMESKAQANLGKVVISAALNLAVRYDLLQHNPAKEIERHKLKPRMRYLTDDEYRKIREHANPALRAAMDISYITSSRISDVLKIRLSDWSDEGLRIKQKKTGAYQLFTWTPALAEAIKEAKKISRPFRSVFLLCSNRGGMYSTSTMRDFWIDARTKAGLPDARFHDIRGKSATDAKREGQDYQALLGHTSKAMADRYIKIEEPQIVEPRRKVL